MNTEEDMRTEHAQGRMPREDEGMHLYVKVTKGFALHDWAESTG